MIILAAAAALVALACSAGAIRISLNARRAEQAAPVGDADLLAVASATREIHEGRERVATRDDLAAARHRRRPQ